MARFEFSIIASGLDRNASDFEGRFFAAGCDDATISFQKGWIVLDFEREAPTVERAVASAVEDVERAGARVEHVEPDPLVSLADIAKRSGLTRAAVSLFANGERGSGFPAPCSRITTDSPLYDWVDVAGWLHQRGTVGVHVVELALVLRTTNTKIMANHRERRFAGEKKPTADAQMA